MSYFFICLIQLYNVNVKLLIICLFLFPFKVQQCNIAIILRALNNYLPNGFTKKLYIFSILHKL